MTSLSGIEGIVWDLDGTLYRFDEAFQQACHLSAARTALSLGLQMTLEDAIALATESERLHGNSFRLFADHGIAYKDFHLTFHEGIDAEIIRRNDDMRVKLEALKIPMVILTNASRPWAERTLKHLGIDHIFGDGNLVALEDVQYQSKGSSPAGFQTALARLGLDGPKVLMVEDIAHNLSMAKTLGMKTALVHHGQREQDVTHVDMFFQHTIELVDALLAVRP